MLIKLEQALIYAGIISLCWMITVLTYGHELSPQCVLRWMQFIVSKTDCW